MKQIILSKSTTGIRFFLLLAMLSFSFASGNTQRVLASADPGNTGTCDQTLIHSENQFLKTLSQDGNPGENVSSRSAALEYIRAAENCYDQLSAQNSVQEQLTDPPIVIDKGGIARPQNLSAEFVLGDAKWGPSTLGTAAGVVTYSFMGNGLDLSSEQVPSYGKSVAISSLPGYQPCFITDIENAFAAWQAVANIQFVKVTDSNTAFDADNAAGDIRIGAHYFDGKSNVLAHAYYPYPGLTGNGDLHFDKDENWTCDTSGTDIGIVALHEIGHALGLQHENTSTIAVMDPYYNSNVSSLRSDDINGAIALYGATAPCNDDFGCATAISSVPHNYTEDTTAATTAADDPSILSFCDGHTLAAGPASVWYKLDPSTNSSIYMDTLGSSYDTYLAVWTGSRGNLTLVTCDDDTLSGFQSQVAFSATVGTTYYVQIAQFGGYAQATASAEKVASQTIGGILKFTVDYNVADTTVKIAGNTIDSFTLPGSSGVRPTYAENDGPAQILTTNNHPIVPSESFVYSYNGSVTSYSEMMGFPSDQLTNEYYFPWYNNVNMWSQLRFANTSSVDPTTVSVYLGTTLLHSYPLNPSQSMRVDYPGTNGGPLRVVSSNNVPIVAAERIIYSDGNGSVQNGNHTSYYELMGFPSNRLSTQYWIPWYNNVNMWTQLRFANTSSTQATTVSVYLGANLLKSYQLNPAQSLRDDYPNVNGGPLRIVSSNNIPIIAAERVIYSVGGVHNGTNTSYSELMAIPNEQLLNRYWFSSYSYPDAGTWGQIRIANPSSTDSTTVKVYLAGNLMGTYPLAANQSQRIDYTGQDDGPMMITTIDGKKLIVAMRVIQSVSGVQTSYSEMLALPDNQVATGYLFPWYNNYNFSTEMRISAP